MTKHDDNDSQTVPRNPESECRLIIFSNYCYSNKGHIEGRSDEGQRVRFPLDLGKRFKHSGNLGSIPSYVTRRSKRSESTSITMPGFATTAEESRPVQSFACHTCLQLQKLCKFSFCRSQRQAFLRLFLDSFDATHNCCVCVTQLLSETIMSQCLS